MGTWFKGLDISFLSVVLCTWRYSFVGVDWIVVVWDLGFGYGYKPKYLSLPVGLIAAGYLFESIIEYFYISLMYKIWVNEVCRAYVW